MSTSWRAPVRKVANATHVLSYMQGEDLTRDAEVPSYVLVRPAGGAFYLMRMNHADQLIYDTWHLTVAEAKAQAEFEFAIADADWAELFEPG